MSIINDRIAYKPLGVIAKEDDDEEHELDCEPDIEEPFSQLRTFGKLHDSVGFHTSSLNSFGFRQLRILLYLVAMLLLILFTAQLFSSSRVDSSRLSTNDVPVSTHASHKVEKVQSQKIQYTANVSSIKPVIAINDEKPAIATGRPTYDTYLTSVLQGRNSRHKPREPFDDLRVPQEDYRTNTSRTRESNNSIDSWWLLGQRNSNKYVTVTNYIRAMKSFNYLDSVTLTTQATVEFMHHTLELCKRWDGPISVAVFCPGVEMSVAVTLIKYMRQCLPIPLSACIRDKVTWHIVYNRAHGPPSDSLGYPESHLDTQHYSLFINQEQCPKFAGPEPKDTIKQLEEALRKSNGVLNSSYREQFNIPYPINVLRNTARQAAETKYVLASDIELYPSINLVPMFIKYIMQNDVKKEPNADRISKFIFTLPIFEVKSNITAPKTKQELIELIKKGDAIFFHKYVCDECQNFPNRLDWMQTDKYGIKEYHANENDELVIFEVTQRDKSKLFWEPIFIGTNEDPPYDDRLSWDGRRDKMAQMYEMCLQGYHLLVLGNAFLVHAPGIKHIDKDDVRRRSNYIVENNKLFSNYMSKLKQQYSDTDNIGKC